MLYTTLTVKENEYKLRLDAKACIDLEKRLGTNPLNVFLTISETGEVPQMTTLIQILHASLTTLNHNITLEKVYEIYNDFIDEGHALQDLLPILIEVFKVSGFFKASEEEKN